MSCKPITCTNMDVSVVCWDVDWQHLILATGLFHLRSSTPNQGNHLFIKLVVKNSSAVQKICGNRRPRSDRSPSATSLTSVWVHVLTHRQFRRSIYFSDDLSFWFLLCRPRPANVLLQFRRQLLSNVSEHFGGLFLCLTLNFTTYFSQFSEHLCFVFLTFWFAHLPAVNSVADCVS